LNLNLNVNLAHTPTRDIELRSFVSTTVNILLRFS